MKVLGCNAAFGLSTQLHIGENVILAISSATAVYLPALPAPPPLTIHRQNFVGDAKVGVWVLCTVGYEGRGGDGEEEQGVMG